MAQAKPANENLGSHLLERLGSYGQVLDTARIQLAFSGGLDSTVLLHLLYSLKLAGKLSATITAVHIHHGLQPQADQWLQHCADYAAQWHIPFLGKKVLVATDTGSSPEEAARKARYAAFAELLPAGGLLLLAHHRDDQVETVMLNLLRGSGPRGLAGIPASRTLGQGLLARPLLAYSREQLENYANQHDLRWVTDFSNSDQNYDRNFLRHSVVQTLKQHWPGMPQSLSRSAQLCAEADQLNVELAQQDFQVARGNCTNQLQLTVLAAFSEARVRNLLRYWVALNRQELGGADITYQALTHTVKDLIVAQADAIPVVCWGPPASRMEIRRFQGMLYLLSPMPELPEQMAWDTREELRLPGHLGVLLYVRSIAAPDASQPQQDEFPQFKVRFRSGGEALQIKARPNKALKKLLQESAVPPWLRDCVPLVYRDDALLAVGDIFQSESWAAESAQSGASITWQRSDLHCGY